MSFDDLPLDVIGSQFALLDPARQRDTAYLCLTTLVQNALKRGAEQVAVAEFDHLLSAVTTFEEGLYRRSIQQLEMAQQVAAKVLAGGAFAPVGPRNAFRLAMLRRRLDLIRLVTPAAAATAAS